MDNQLHHNAPHHHPMLLPKLDAMTLHAPPSSDYFCLYKTNKCRNLRGVKRDGTLHRLCNDHREKANESQRKSETKKRSKQTLQGAASSAHPQHPPAYAGRPWDGHSMTSHHQPESCPTQHPWDDDDSTTDGSRNNSPSGDHHHMRSDGSSRMTLDFILAHHDDEYDSDSCSSGSDDHSRD